MVGTEKKCSSCKQIKDLSLFCKKAVAKDGYAYNCKECNKASSKKWASEHPERIVELNRLWNEANPDKVRERSQRRRLEDPEYHRDCARRSKRKHSVAHSKRCVAWAKKNNPKKMKEDPEFKLRVNLRIRMCNFLKGKIKSGSAVGDLGCTSSELKLHIEANFTSGMSWENYGRGKGKWTIDHIMPLKAFTLEDRQHFLLASHYLNLRPLWHDENTRKSNKFPTEFL